MRLMGRAAADGFYVYGHVGLDAVSQAAGEGLARLKRGEANLAVSPLCGTNIVAGGLLAGLASVLAMRGRRLSEDLPSVFIAATAALVLAQPLGRVAQRHVTTFASVEDVDIVEVVCLRPGRYKIKTVQGQT